MKKYLYELTNKSLLIVGLLGSLLFGYGCQPADTSTPAELHTQPAHTITATKNEPGDGSTQTPTQPIEAGYTATPTPDLRMDPSDWQNWPIVPDRISARMVEVYFQGIAAGNNPQAFSKVGDCQNITEAFLGLFDSGKYTLEPNSVYMEETIDHFQGSFGRESQAVRGGFNVASVLSPMWADLEYCQPGETPLECELRLHQPSLVIISMETWFPGRTPETYEGYLRQIIEKVIDANAVPLLATKADNAEGNHSINGVIAELAFEYDLPLWNFWRAVQPLPDHGIDWDRDPGGFHITYEAWTVRSFSALWALDTLWRLLNTFTNEAALSPTPAQVTKPAAPPPELTGAPPGEGILFSLAEYQDGSYIDSGVYAFDVQKPQLSQLSEQGYRLLGTSPTHDRILISGEHSLFVVPFTASASASTRLTDSFFNAADQGALWTAEDQIFYIEHVGQATAIVSTDTKGDNSSFLTDTTHHPLELYAYDQNSRLYWEDSSCYSSVCLSSGTRWTSTVDNVIAEFPGATSVRAASAGGRIAYTVKAEDNHLLYVRSLTASDTLVRASSNIITDYAWSQDGNQIAFIEVLQSDYSGRQVEQHYFVASAPDWTLNEIHLQGYHFTHLLWSSDGSSLWFIGTDNEENLIHFLSVNPSQRTLVSTNSISIPWGNLFPFIRNAEFISIP